MQRIFDIVFSLLALIVLSSLLIPVVILLRLTGEGEIFYLQERIGKDGKPFRLYKFATMLRNSPSFGTGTVTIKNDPRILPIGRFLRKTKINELPQLINILFGDMSLIGPRPLTRQAFDFYSDRAKSVISRVRPGLSGVGSIIFRTEEDVLSGASSSLNFYKEIIAPYKGELEIWFVKNNNLSNYFKAILVTVVVVIIPKSQISWRVFAGLPIPPEELKKALGFVRREQET